MVIVDTTAWVDYLNGVSTPEVEWFERQTARQRLGLLDLMVCEILQGLSTDGEATRVLRHLRRFEIFETGGVDLATAAARNYRRLRARGKTVRKTIDCLIATFCMEHGHSLLHRDRDFECLRGVPRSGGRPSRRRRGRQVTLARSEGRLSGLSSV